MISATLFNCKLIVFFNYIKLSKSLNGRVCVWDRYVNGFPERHIYDSGEIPSDLSKYIFIALPKKPGATECESHRTISLLSHIVGSF